MLVTKGTKDQFEACGLLFVGDQMKLLEVVEMESEESADSVTYCTNKARKIKPSTKRLSSDLLNRIYNAK